MQGRYPVPLGYRMFLAMSLPFGVIMGLVLSPTDPLLALQLGLSSGFAFGIAMTLILGTTHVIATSQGGKRSAVLGVRHCRTLSFPGDRQTLHRLLQDAFAQLGVTEPSFDAEAGVLCGHTPWSLWGWGETLRAEIKPGASGLDVRFTSTPRLAVSLVDYGNNLDNVERIVRILEASSVKPGSGIGERGASEVSWAAPQRVPVPPALERG